MVLICGPFSNDRQPASHASRHWHRRRSQALADRVSYFRPKVSTGLGDDLKRDVRQFIVGQIVLCEPVGEFASDDAIHLWRGIKHASELWSLGGPAQP